MRIVVHIERIVLDDGIAGRDAASAIGHAVRERVAALLAERGLPAIVHGGAVDRLDAGTVDAARGPTAIGGGIASSLVGLLTRDAAGGREGTRT